MSKIIIYTQENGNMGVCIPNPKLDIDFVKEKDCPNGIIVDQSIVENLDKNFFEGYEIVNNEPVINEFPVLWPVALKVSCAEAIKAFDDVV